MSCPATLASCVCQLLDGHEGPHVCKCLGAWDEAANIVRFPRFKDDGTPALMSPWLVLPEPQPGAAYRMVGETEWEPVA